VARNGQRVVAQIFYNAVKSDIRIRMAMEKREVGMVEKVKKSK